MPELKHGADERATARHQSHCEGKMHGWHHRRIKRRLAATDLVWMEIIIASLRLSTSVDLVGKARSTHCAALG